MAKLRNELADVLRDLAADLRAQFGPDEKIDATALTETMLVVAERIDPECDEPTPGDLPTGPMSQPNHYDHPPEPVSASRTVEAARDPKSDFSVRLKDLYDKAGDHRTGLTRVFDAGARAAGQAAVAMLNPNTNSVILDQFVGADAEPCLSDAQARAADMVFDEVVQDSAALQLSNGGDVRATECPTHGEIGLECRVRGGDQVWRCPHCDDVLMPV